LRIFFGVDPVGVVVGTQVVEAGDGVGEQGQTITRMGRGTATRALSLPRALGLPPGRPATR
jgi:hypothetical protein